MSGNERKTYRLRTGVGNEAPASLNVNLTQTYDIVDVLSLELNQTNFYKMPRVGYGAVVGRVIANSGFGIPNAKVSVFVPYEVNSLFEENNFLYRFTSPETKDSEGVRYNLLPRRVDDNCHQDVGTLPEKEYLLDNKDLIQVFDKYYKYTAVTNDSGDYFIYGVPVGTQTIHVDLDLSDIGVLSQRPRDMIYKGYNINQFDNPNKFKKDKNLNSLAQIYSQDKVVTVYPFWGDTSEDPTVGTLTRCDINIDYKFEPTCVFMGSIVSDTGNRAISQRCVPDDEIGKMSELVTGEGKIEMIRKTFDGKVEEFSIKGNALIDGDGVWCYQIPMNLDYVMTDEFGNLVPTDNPERGIATRARVRFRISMNETETDETARKRARFLVPNNPKLTDDYPDFLNRHEADYEFGTFTKEESYRDLFWNKVYTVKSYIPRLQKAKAMRRRVHTGIKNVNHAGDNNPFPFNNLFIRLTFAYRFLCSIMSLFCLTIYWTNNVLAALALPLYYLGWILAWIDNNLAFGEGVFDIFNPIGSLIGLLLEEMGLNGLAAIFRHPVGTIAKTLLVAVEKSHIKLDNFCDEGNYTNKPYLLCEVDDYLELFTNPEKEVNIENLNYSFPKNKDIKNWNTDLNLLFNCIENQLVQDQECTSFNFNNDWVNGVLYAPLWYRKIRSKKRIFFNLIPIPAKDKWCNGMAEVKSFNKLSICHTCAPKRKLTSNELGLYPLDNSTIDTASLANVLTGATKEENCYGYKCHKKTISFITVDKGLIIPKETMLGENVYYYKSVEYDGHNLKSQDNPNQNGDVKTLFATDIVLLGSLNDCDADGVPQFFKGLESTTYNMPPDLVLMDYEVNEETLKYEQRAVDNETVVAEGKIGIGDAGLEDVDDEFDENDSIDNLNSVYTDKTGADWGNYGREQVKDEDRPNETSYDAKAIIYPSKNENPDFGGLFYGISCWSAYTKPKSCINLSRICEYGVSLDETQEYPDYTNREPDGQFATKTMAPDGFISYDELYDKDGRAMFATMNGNNLKTKINPKNGFPVYDFMYLYPENFDGSMKAIMRPIAQPLPFPQSENYAVEESSEAYMRFRYGRNRADRHVVKFYKSNLKQNFYPTSAAKQNTTRFPKYENSFYFYFGLVPGSTAIDKFREQYYSDCRDTEGEMPVVSVDFEANDWCSEVTTNPNSPYEPGNGWIAIDASNLDSPYDISLLNMSGEPEYDLTFTGIEKPKIIITVSESNLPEEPDYLGEGYEILEENGVVFGLLNGMYKLVIVDVNGLEFSRTINFTKPYISATVGRTAFRYKNEELSTLVGQWGNGLTGDAILDIAQLGGAVNDDMSDRKYGGFIKVTDISQEGDRYINFAIDIKPLFKVGDAVLGIISGTDVEAQQSLERNIHPISSYNGTAYELHQHTSDPLNNAPQYVVGNKTLMKEHGAQQTPTPLYCPYTYDYPQYPENYDVNGYQTNGGRYDIRFGVPKGDVKYRVTVTMLCLKQGVYRRSRNSITTDILVPQPMEFKMLVNGIDYKLIKEFNTGWKIHSDNPSNDFDPSVDYYPMFNEIDNFTPMVDGWLELENIDGLTELEPADESTNFNYSDIETTDLLLGYTRFDPPTSPPTGFQIKSWYNWCGKYRFYPSEVLPEFPKFNEIPTALQSVDITLIRVLDADSGEYYYYEWDGNGYVLLNGEQSTVLSMESYYNHCSLDMKNTIISLYNNYISLRKSFVESVKNAFMVERGDTFSLTVKGQTYEVPVKTFIGSAHDLPDGTTEPFQPISEQFDESTCYDITTCTLTGLLLDPTTGKYYYLNGEENINKVGIPYYQPTANDCNGATCYKQPWLVAVQNAIIETLPLGIGNLRWPIDTAHAAQLFGVHMIDKRLTLVYNSWACMENWPMYTIEPNYAGYFTLPGLFAGFVLNGLPESYDEMFETYFDEQDINGEDIKILTLSTESDTVDETRLPVVRVFHRGGVDNDYYRNYTLNTNGNKPIIIPTSPSTWLGYAGVYHYLLHSLDTRLHIRDKNGSHDFFFNDVVEPIDIEYDFFYSNNSGGNKYKVNITFAEGYKYWIYLDEPNIMNGSIRTTNPVYKKYYSIRYTTNPDNNVMKFKPNGNDTPDMQFWCNTFGVPQSDNKPIFTRSYSQRLIMYAIRMTNDLQRRVISKTYDLTPIEYKLLTIPPLSVVENEENYGVHIAINLGYGSYFDYLKCYPFTIQFVQGDSVVYEFEHEQYVDLGGAVNESYYSTNIYPNEALIHQYDENVYYMRLYVAHMPNSTYDEVLDFKNQLEVCDAYLTDATGLRRKMKKVPNYTGTSYQPMFKNTFNLLINPPGVG